MTTEHKNIYAALAKAQAEMGNAMRDSENPHFKSKYADLASVREACLPPLNQNGIAVIQPFIPSETHDHFVKTMFVHESGETLECSVPLLLAKKDMQGLGAAITYARRYGLMMMAGVAPDDEDGDGNATQTNAMGAALGDAWEQGILDGLPENASPLERAKAFTKAICKEFDGKGERALNNAWNKRQRFIKSFEQRFPDLHERIVDAFENRRIEIEAENAPMDREAANGFTAGHG